MKNKALIAGSTGLVGECLVNTLVSENISVKALVREDRVSSIALLEYIKINFDNLNQSHDLFLDVKDLYICLGTTIKRAGSKEAFQKVDVQYCLDIAKGAVKGGVKNLSIITSIGADSNSSNFYLKTKGIIEEEISKLDFESISIHRPGLLIGPRKDIRVGEMIGQKIHPVLINPILIKGLRKYRCIDIQILAKSMAYLSGLKKGKNFYYFDDFIKNLNK